MFQNTAFDWLQKELKTLTISTRSEKFDRALNNGITTGAITEICGFSGSGKTQLCLQLAVNTTIPKPLGIDGDVVYISSRRNFFQKRLIEICKPCVARSFKQNSIKSGYNTDSIMKRIHCNTINNVEELIAAVTMTKELVKKHTNIRLIIIDSFSSTLRTLEKLDSIRIVYEIMKSLQQIADDRECAIVITNELTTSLLGNSIDQQAIIVPALGEAFHHRVSQRILFVKSLIEENVINVQVQKNLWSGKSNFKIKITNRGIEDY
ncbi:unnamed protein product [Diamesa hyperborea]